MFSDDYYIHIKFLSDSITVFCWLLIMKLRHKKPLNPYKGQTNNDKNEFNDDDFRQQESPLKKVKRLSIKNGSNPTDQIFKYARILSKFVKTINQDYRLVSPQDELFDLPLSPERPSSRPRPELPPERQTILPKKQQLKQQKQLPKLQNKIELKEQRKQAPPIPKKREPHLSTPLSKQIKNASHNSLSNAQLNPNPTLTPPKTQPENKNSKLVSQKTEPSRSSIDLLAANKTQNPKITPLASSANSIVDQRSNPAANYPNLINMSGLPGNFPAMMNPNQLLSNLNFINMSAMNGLNPMQLTQLLMRNYNQNYIYGGLPASVGLNNLGMMGMGVPNMQNPHYLFAQNKAQPKTYQNLFSEQAKSFKTIEVAGENDFKAAYPLKRSAFHIAISYKIYLDKLKQAGKSLQNLEEIDPTKNARRIKSNQQPRNAKELAKKKK